MCTSRWLLSDIGWFYILLLSSPTDFYLIFFHQHQTPNSKMIRASTWYFSVIVSSFDGFMCIFWADFVFNWNTFGEIKMLTAYSASWFSQDTFELIMSFSQDIKYMGVKCVADSEVSISAKGKETYIGTHNEYTWWALYFFQIEGIPGRQNRREDQCPNSFVWCINPSK